MGYRSNSRTELRARGNFQQPQFQPKARDVLVSWARAREYLDRAGSYLKLARATPDPHVRDRFIAVAQHYRALAVAEQSITSRRCTRVRRCSSLRLPALAQRRWATSIARRFGNCSRGRTLQCWQGRTA